MNDSSSVRRICPGGEEQEVYITTNSRCGKDSAAAALCLPLEGKAPEGRMKWKVMQRRENTSSVSLALDSFPSKGMCRAKRKDM